MTLDDLGKSIVESFKKLSPARQAQLRKEMLASVLEGQMMDYAFMIFLRDLGSLELDWTFAGTLLFQTFVAVYGTEEEKIRLDAMEVGYRYRPASKLTLSASDVLFLNSLGISTKRVTAESLQSEE